MPPSRQLRFFAHAPGAPKCALAEQSPAHHLLKLELVAAAREAGAHAELEVRGPDDAWRANVLASDPGGGWKTALEAQVSPLTTEDIAGRTERMFGDGVSSVWFSDRVRAPWLGTVPWARLQTVDGALAVVEGHAKFSGNRWEAGPQVPVGEFLRWVFAARVVPYRRRAPVHSPLGAWSILWTAPQYAEAERVHLAEQNGASESRRNSSKRSGSADARRGTARYRRPSSGPGRRAGTRPRSRPSRRGRPPWKYRSPSSSTARPAAIPSSRTRAHRSTPWASPSTSG
ncbi:competence protein CoiA family protein [Streptomyces vinaceus]